MEIYSLGLHWYFSEFPLYFRLPSAITLEAMGTDLDFRLGHTPPATKMLPRRALLCSPSEILGRNMMSEAFRSLNIHIHLWQSKWVPCSHEPIIFNRSLVHQYCATHKTAKIFLKKMLKNCYSSEKKLPVIITIHLQF